MDDAQNAVLLAEVLHRIEGSSTTAYEKALEVSRRDDITTDVRSRCYTVVGGVLFEKGHYSQARRYLNRGVEEADRSESMWCQARARLRMMSYVADCGTAESVLALSRDTYIRCIASGDAALLAELHVCLAQLEAARGCLEGADTHLFRVGDLLEHLKNPWLEAHSMIVRSVVAFLRGDLMKAIALSERAWLLGTESSHARTQVAAANNLAHFLMTRGEWVQASECLSRTEAQVKGFCDGLVAFYDNQAGLRLLRGDFEQCERFLTLATEVRPDETFGRSWVALEMMENPLRLKLARQRYEDAVIAASRAIELADERRDRVLGTRFRILAADALILIGRIDDAARLISEAAVLPLEASPTAIAEIERVTGKLLTHIGRLSEAKRHFQRARRIAQALGNVPLDQEVGRDSANMCTSSSSDVNAGDSNSDGIGNPGLEVAAILLQLAGHPELLGRELVALSTDISWIKSCALLSRAGSSVHVWSPDGWREGKAATHGLDANCTTTLGGVGGREIVVLIEPSEDPEALYAVAALRRLIEAALALERARQEEKRRSALWSFDPPGSMGDGVFLASASLEVLSIARKIAPTDLPVLITGETGTGKELLARVIHAHSKRDAKPFVPFNCTAMPRDLVESQLFGHRRGAFTGAQDHFPGILRAAAGGTIFLDEIGELAPEAQPKLLRFLETGEIHPLGEAAPLNVAVRVVAATNVDLDRLVAEGRFREDLYYRLNVVRLTIPPLRERREEIPPLLHHFIAKYCAEQRKMPLRVADDTLEYLLLYSWPGNVRQLSNEIRRVVALAEPGSIIEPAHLSPDIRASRRTVPADQAPPAEHITIRIDRPLAGAMEEVERVMLERALRLAHGNLETAAHRLGISRKGLYLKRHRLGLADPTAT